MIEPREIRTVFMGTPDFALPTLQGLIEAGVNLCAVFTQPDRAKGRGRKLAAPPVKELATQHQIPVYQPEKLRSPDSVAVLRELAPDLIVVVAYGQILPKSVLDIPKYGCINVHASLLPRYRGAAPINMAIINGEKETGVTTMLMDVGLDTGDMLVKRATAIGPLETAGQLHDRLAVLGREAMEETLRQLCAGELKPEPQDDSQTCYASMMSKSDGRIDWAQNAETIHDLVRGLHPWPGAYTFLAGEMLKIADTLPHEEVEGLPGTIVSATERGILVSCGQRSLFIRSLQLPGKKWLSAAEFLRGRPIEPGVRLEL